jgi:hypothetical protein
MRRFDLRSRFKELFAADLRSLALMRILTGAGLVYDISYRAADLEAHYTDQGVLPAALAHELVREHGWFSIHTLSGSYGYQLLLAGIFLAAALCLTAGAWTRIASVVCWFLFVSVQNRFFLADYPGDYVLTMLLLWGVFLPWGQYASINAWRRQTSPPPRHAGLAAYAFFFQFCIFLSKTGISKIAAGGRWDDGTALFFTLDAVRYTSGTLDWALAYPTLLELVTHVVPYAELLSPLLIFWPWQNGVMRTVAVALLCGMFASFGLGLDLHLLPYFAGVAFLGFLPAWFWDVLVARVRGRLRGASSPSPDEPRNAGWTSAAMLIPGRAPRALHTALAGIVLALVATHYFYKIGNFGYFASPAAPPAFIDRTLDLLKIENIFRMFSDPSVFEQNDGWDVAPGVLADGRQVNVLNGEPLSFERPPRLLPAIRGFRWRQYLTLMHWYPRWNPRSISSYASVDATRLRTLMARYLCLDWNRRHAGLDRLVRMNLAIVVAPMEYAKPRGPHQVIELSQQGWRCDAFEDGEAP